MFSIFLLVLRRHDGQIQSDPTAMLFVILLNLGENNVWFALLYPKHKIVSTPTHKVICTYMVLLEPKKVKREVWLFRVFPLDQQSPVLSQGATVSR